MAFNDIPAWGTDGWYALMLKKPAIYPNEVCACGHVAYIHTSREGYCHRCKCTSFTKRVVQSG